VRGGVGLQLRRGDVYGEDPEAELLRNAIGEGASAPAADICYRAPCWPRGQRVLHALVIAGIQRDVATLVKARGESSVCLEEAL
jgi:hypothetical protein